MEKELYGEKIMIKDVRLNYPRVLKPVDASAKYDAGKYTTDIICENPENPDMIKLLKECAKLIKERFGCELKDKQHPFLKDKEGFEGMYYFKAKTGDKFPPGVVDRDCKPITDTSKVYSGVYCNIIVTPKTYNLNKTQSGVTLSLNAIQIVRDGDRLGGEGSNIASAKMFEPVPTTELDVQSDDDVIPF